MLILVHVLIIKFVCFTIWGKICWREAESNGQEDDWASGNVPPTPTSHYCLIFFTAWYFLIFITFSSGFSAALPHLTLLPHISHIFCCLIFFNFTSGFSAASHCRLTLLPRISHIFNNFSHCLTKRHKRVPSILAFSIIPTWGFLLPLTLLAIVLPHISPRTHIFNNFVFFTVSCFFPTASYLSQFYIHISPSEFLSVSYLIST